jgi:RNA polymerase sigma factor (sigma-70 family)
MHRSQKPLGLFAGAGSNEPLLELLNAASNGDDRSLNELLDRIGRAVERFLCSRSQGNAALRTLVPDWTQESIIRISSGLGRAEFQTDRALMSWCLTVAKNTAVDLIRRDSRHIVGTVLEGEIEQVAQQEGRSPHAPPLWNRPGLRSEMNRILDGLDDETHQILWRRLVEHESWAEIAKEMGSSTGAIKRRWQRLQERFRREITSDFVFD